MLHFIDTVPHAKQLIYIRYNPHRLKDACTMFVSNFDMLSYFKAKVQVEAFEYKCTEAISGLETEIVTGK
jgi:hypothetical protein